MILAATLLATPIVHAEEPTPVPIEDVEVSRVRDPEIRPYAAMVRGIDAFQENHARAPLAELRFQLVAAQGSLEGLQIRLQSPHHSMDVAVAQDGSFTLPRSGEMLDDGAELELNRPKGSIRWHPVVHTPGVPDDQRRLGDLRLECEVFWAVERENVPLMARAAFALAGGLCHSSRLEVDFPLDPAVVAVSLAQEDRRQDIRVNATNHTYWPPLHDRSWNDEARLTLRRP